MPQLDRSRDDEAANAAMDAYADGNDAAFSNLYDALAPRLFGFVVRQARDRQRAEDILQETMLNIHRARGQYARGSDVVPWAFAIARRLCIDRLRRRRLEERVEQGDEEVPEIHVRDEAGADDWIFARQLAGRLEAELDRLPESQRAAFELLRRDGLSHAQAAEVLGTTVSAVKLRAHRAYERLHAALQTENLVR